MAKKPVQVKGIDMATEKNLKNVMGHLQLLGSGQRSPFTNAEAIQMLTDGLSEIKNCLSEFLPLAEDEDRGPYHKDVDTAERLVGELSEIV